MARATRWRLVAFRDDVPLTVQAGAEAALEVFQPAGRLGQPPRRCHAARPRHSGRGGPGRARHGPDLLQVLRTEDDIKVPAPRPLPASSPVSRTVRVCPAATAAVFADGAWRLALATGTWSKLKPAYVGDLARQRPRQRRIGELTDRSSEMNAALAALDDRLRILAARRVRSDADRAARPDYRELDARRRDWDRAEERAAARDDAVRDAAARSARCESEAPGALRTLSRRPDEQGLHTDRSRLRELSGHLDRFRDTADTWAHAPASRPSPPSEPSSCPHRRIAHARSPTNGPRTRPPPRLRRRC